MNATPVATPVKPNHNRPATVADIAQMTRPQFRAFTDDMDARIRIIRSTPALENRVRSQIEVAAFGYATPGCEPKGQNWSVADSLLSRPYREGVAYSLRDEVMAIIVAATTATEPTPEEQAATAAAEGRASVRPTVESGLSQAERTAVRKAIHAAIVVAGESDGNGFVTITIAAREAGRIAGNAALAAVLALRPRQPEPKPDPEPTRRNRRVDTPIDDATWWAIATEARFSMALGWSDAEAMATELVRLPSIGGGSPEARPVKTRSTAR